MHPLGMALSLLDLGQSKDHDEAVFVVVVHDSSTVTGFDESMDIQIRDDETSRRPGGARGDE